MYKIKVSMTKTSQMKGEEEVASFLTLSDTQTQLIALFNKIVIDIIEDSNKNWNVNQ